MSGLISSLLIETIVRQARRLSNQTDSHPPYDDDLADSLPITQSSSSSATYDGNDHAEVSSRNGDHETSARGTPSVPSPPPPSELSSWRHDMSPNQSRSGTAIVSPQSLRGLYENEHVDGVRTYTAPEVTGADSPSVSLRNMVLETNPSAQESHHYSASHDNLDDIGDQFLLPEDDGMGVLRKKIHAIRDLQCSNEEKARMIHELMTERYNASRGRKDLIPTSPRTLSSSSPQLSERSVTPISRCGSLSSDHAPTNPASRAPTSHQIEDTYKLTAEDLKPTFFPKSESDSPVCDFEDADAEDVEVACLGCRHYRRNVKLQCFACKKWYTCRFCHDEVEDHHLDRPKTENMLCMLCGHAQPAAAVCRQCGKLAAQYYCNICKLWDNDSNKKNTHRCIERSTQCDCPICGDYMFTSPETVVFMRCGHSIHQKCLSEYSKSSYRCPICSKTIANMESTFRNLDRTIQSQPMPAEFKDTSALIHCNDCGAKSVVRYHWLGLKCDMCESYNTAQIRLLHGEASDSLDRAGGDNRDASASPMPSTFHGTEEEASISLPLAQLRVDTSSPSGADSSPRFIASSSAEQNGRFSSYSLTRGRAVSPVISNYFGLPPDRESNRSKSTLPFFGDLAGKYSNDHAGGNLRLWGTNIKYKYGFLDRGTESTEGTSEVEGEGDDSDDSTDGESMASDEADSGDPEEDDDEDEGIDIFGHR
ncbi:CHY and RING finger domain-containing protein [Aspergillus fumigatus Z5]|nr:CHY and RING finger domain-containing protein [Aspergillus fumigatus Z5]